MENVIEQEPLKNQPNLSKKFPTLTILTIIVVVGYTLSGVFITKNVSLSKNTKSLQEELEMSKSALNSEKQKGNDLEKELIFYKNTDLVKEVELLQLKLEKLDEELSDVKNELSATRNESRALQANTKKIKPYLDAINAIEAMLSEGPKAGNVANVDSKIEALKDSEVSSQWARAKASIDLEKASWSGSDVSATVTLITSRILSLVQ